MRTDVDYVIIGGGPIGLLTGILLLNNGYSVKIFEEDHEIGESQHCSGIISLNTLKLYPIKFNNLIISRLYGVKILIDNIFENEYIGSTYKAVIINRVKFEKLLYDKFVEKGGDLEKNKRIDTKNLIKDHKYVYINAAGAKELLMDGYKDVIPGVQYDVMTEDTLMLKNREVCIYVNKQINPDYFNWIAPLNHEIYRVGTVSKEKPINKINNIIRDLNLRIRFKVNELFGHIVAGGPRREFIKNEVIYVGDSAGMTKITTGGGLNYGAFGSHILVQSILEDELNRYRNLWISKFEREIIIQKLIRDVFLKLNNNELIEILGILSKKEILNQLLLIGNMDYHASDLFKLIYDRDLMKTFLKKKLFMSLLKGFINKV